MVYLKEDQSVRITDRGQTSHSLYFADACFLVWQDPTLPPNDVNTLLINFYNPGATFKWHKDSEDPNLIREGKGKPIVSHLL